MSTCIQSVEFQCARWATKGQLDTSGLSTSSNHPTHLNSLSSTQTGAFKNCGPRLQKPRTACKWEAHKEKFPTLTTRWLVEPPTWSQALQMPFLPSLEPGSTTSGWVNPPTNCRFPPHEQGSAPVTEEIRTQVVYYGRYFCQAENLASPLEASSLRDSSSFTLSLVDVGRLISGRSLLGRGCGFFPIC